MTNPGRLPAEEKRLDRLVERSIESHVGRMASMPSEVAERLFGAHRDLLPAYVEMLRMRGDHPEDWWPSEIAIDPEVLEGLSHFFSDYQHIVRRFIRVNRQVSRLMRLDRQADSRRFEAHVNDIVSGDEAPAILDSIVGR